MRALTDSLVKPLYHKANAATGLALRRDTAAYIGIIAAIGIIQPADGDPLAKPRSNHRVGALYINHALVVAVQPIVIGAQGNGRHLAVKPHCCVKSLGDVLVLGLLNNPSVSVGSARGQGHALPALNQYGIAFASDYLSHAVIRRACLAVDYSGLITLAAITDDDIRRTSAYTSIDTISALNSATAATIGQANT